MSRFPLLDVLSVLTWQTATSLIDDDDTSSANPRDRTWRDPGMFFVWPSYTSTESDEATGDEARWVARARKARQRWRVDNP